MRIAVVYSLPSRRLLGTPYGETDADSANIARMVARGLEFKGHKIALIPVAEDNLDKIGEIEADCVFNLIEWCGEDIELAGKAFHYLRTLNIPVTGDTEAMFRLSGDKIRMKEVLQKLGIPTPQGVTFVTGEEIIPGSLPYPMIVKPSLEHCSVGLGDDAIAHDCAELENIARRQIATFHQPALAEAFIIGREMLIYLLEENGLVRMFQPEELIFKTRDPMAFQTYAAKWEENSPEYSASEVVPAVLTEEEGRVVRQTCTRAFTQLGMRGYARFDTRMKNGVLYILEVNANPSVFDGDETMTDVNQEVIWGIKFPDYLEAIVQAATWHYERGEKI